MHLTRKGTADVMASVKATLLCTGPALQLYDVAVQDKVSAGDHVTFRIANNSNAAKQAEKLGAKVSKLVGELSFASTEHVPGSMTAQSSGIISTKVHSTRVPCMSRSLQPPCIPAPGYCLRSLCRQTQGPELFLVPCRQESNTGRPSEAVRCGQAVQGRLRLHQIHCKGRRKAQAAPFIIGTSNPSHVSSMVNQA